MSASFNRTDLGRGIGLTRIYDDKFKSVSTYLFFITKVDQRNIVTSNMIPKLLITSNGKIRSRTELNKRLMKLYGSSVAVASARAGDNQMFGLCSNSLADKFTIDGEEVSAQVTDILLDCALDPDIDENGFNEKYFGMRKQDVIDGIRSYINDKRGYAIVQARKRIYEGEPSAVTIYDGLEIASNLDRKELALEYKELLRRARIEVFVVGHSDAEKNTQRIIDALSKIEREPDEQIVFRTPSPVKDDVSFNEETIDAKQSKLVMAFKTDYDNIYVNKLMAMLYGGVTFSKLFVNVREKLSLCYYCSAGFADTKNVMIVDSGTDRTNCDRAREEILKQLKAVADGDFTDEELENTKLALCSGFKSNNDNISDMAAWYLTQFTRNTSNSPEEICEQVNAVTREQIIKAAASMKLDTVYVLSPEEVQGVSEDDN